MQKQKSLKQFGLNQLIDNSFHLNVPISASGLNSSSFNNISSSFNSSKILPMTSNNPGDGKRNNQMILKAQRQRYSKQQPTNLIKSKQILQKFTNKLSSVNLRKLDSSPIQFVKAQIYETTFEINKQIDKKIQNSFSKILNNETVMPMADVVRSEKQNDEKADNTEKQNFLPNTLSLVEGTKMLMTQYWQKDRVKNVQTPKLSKNILSSDCRRPNFTQVSPNLPKINQKAYGNVNKNPNIILGKLTKHQRRRQQLLKQKDQQLKHQFYSFNVDILDFKIQNQSKQFLLFQRVNYKNWEDIFFVLQCIEKFCQWYQVSQGKVNLKRVLELVEMGQKRDKVREAFKAQQLPRSSFREMQSTSQNIMVKAQYTTHQLLSCFEDAEKISQNHSSSKGIRFFGNRGKKRAIVRIQSHFRRFISRKKFSEMKRILQKVILIQRNYRSYLTSCRTKQEITQIQLKKIQKFKQLQTQFRQNYRKNEITKKIKYEIHLCSMSSTEWQRVTTQNINERQNTQLSRIFRIATKTTPLIETRIIYIAPNELPKEIVSYYKKIFHFGSESGEQNQIDDADKLNILWPENVQKLPQSLSLTQKLMYSKSTMKRLKRLVRGNYCYIVPSMPSNDFISLSCVLNVPLYSCQPQKLLYLQSKAGMKQFGEVLKQTKDEYDSFGVLPYSMNIYNKTSFINELTFLVFNYPSVRRWVLKIDNQNSSRGLAYIDTSKILKSQIIDKLLNPSQSSTKQSPVKQQVYSRLYESIITYKQQRIIPVSKQIYRNQEQFLNHFLSNGGIIQASINNFQSDLENHCFVIQIEPDSQWKFIGSYYKITNKNKAIGCYYDSQTEMQPPIQIEAMVRKLIQKDLFGFFTFEFLKIPNSRKAINTQSVDNGRQNLTYFNGIQCHLSELSSASFLKQFLSKDTNVLYIPFLSHPSLKQLRIQTFFHLCRLQNISFDIQRKIGNVFMFLNGLQSGCMGLMSFNGISKQETFQQVSDVLQFLSSKLCQSSNLLKKIPKSFMSVRNVVNGYLKKDRDHLLRKDIRNTCSANNIHKLL